MDSSSPPFNRSEWPYPHVNRRQKIGPEQSLATPSIIHNKPQCAYPDADHAYPDFYYHSYNNQATADPASYTAIEGHAAAAPPHGQDIFWTSQGHGEQFPKVEPPNWNEYLERPSEDPEESLPDSSPSQTRAQHSEKKARGKLALACTGVATILQKNNRSTSSGKRADNINALVKFCQDLLEENNNLKQEEPLQSPHKQHLQSMQHLGGPPAPDPASQIQNHFFFNQYLRPDDGQSRI